MRKTPGEPLDAGARGAGRRRRRAPPARSASRTVPAIRRPPSSRGAARRRGRCSVKGQPAHSSQIFRADIGAGAIFEAARILNAFREKLAGEPHLTFNPGVIVGGTAVEHSTRADHAAPRSARPTSSPSTRSSPATCGRSRRSSSPREEGDGGDRGGVAAARRRPTITFDDGYPPLAPTDGNRKLLAMYDKASRDVGAGAVDGRRSAIAPARPTSSFVAGEVKMIIDGVGLMGQRRSHRRTRPRICRRCRRRRKRAAVLLLRLARNSLSELEHALPCVTAKPARRREGHESAGCVWIWIFAPGSVVLDRAPVPWRVSSRGPAGTLSLV